MPDKAKFLLDPGIKPKSPILQADALTSAPPEKPLNTKIQSLRKPPIETQNFRSKYNIKDFKGGKEARLKKKGEEAGGRGKRGGLTDVSCHLQIPRRYGAFPWASREGRTGTRPYQKSEPEFEFSAKRR